MDENLTQLQLTTPATPSARISFLAVAFTIKKAAFAQEDYTVRSRLRSDALTHTLPAELVAQSACRAAHCYATSLAPVQECAPLCPRPPGTALSTDSIVRARSAVTTLISPRNKQRVHRLCRRIARSRFRHRSTAPVVAYTGTSRSLRLRARTPRFPL